MGQDTRYGEKIPSFLKRAGTFKGQLRQRPTGPAATTIWHTTTGSKGSRQTHHTAKEKASADDPSKALFQHLLIS